MNDKQVAGFFIEGWYVFDNFAPFQIEWRGKLYPTSEHAYQAAHFLETDTELAERVRLARSPRIAADIANANSDKDDPDWASKKLAIMQELVLCKYEQHEYIREVLYESADKEIIEMNDDDSFWGWGKDHKGMNELGKTWMRLRDERTAIDG